VVDGQIVSGILPRTNLPVSVFFDAGLSDFPFYALVYGLADEDFGSLAKPGEVLYAGGSPGSVAGLLQVNVRVPVNAEVTGDRAPLALLIGSHWTVYQVTVALR
jgi:hypothetical protein